MCDGWVGKQLAKFDDFVNDEIPGGWWTVGGTAAVAGLGAAGAFDGLFGGEELAGDFLSGAPEFTYSVDGFGDMGDWTSGLDSFTSAESFPVSDDWGSIVGDLGDIGGYEEFGDIGDWYGTGGYDNLDSLLGDMGYGPEDYMGSDFSQWDNLDSLLGDMGYGPEDYMGSDFSQWDNLDTMLDEMGYGPEDYMGSDFSQWDNLDTMLDEMGYGPGDYADYYGDYAVPGMGALGGMGSMGGALGGLGSGLGSLFSGAGKLIGAGAPLLARALGGGGRGGSMGGNGMGGMGGGQGGGGYGSIGPASGLGGGSSGTFGAPSRAQYSFEEFKPVNTNLATVTDILKDKS